MHLLLYLSSVYPKNLPLDRVLEFQMSIFEENGKFLVKIYQNAQLNHKI